MTLYQWFVTFLIIQVVHFLATWKLYVKAGKQAWQAAIPVYNAIVLFKIINRPWWWIFLLFLPIINIIIIPVIWVETIRSFGRNSKADTALVLLTLGFYIFYVNYSLDVTYIQDRDLKPRTVAGEWTNSIIFAVIAATFVHTYIMQPFVIPTPSLEKTLLVGDFLFVSKFHYGARVPMTAIAAPMVHDTLPILGKSYLPHPQYPYFRLPGLQKIERNEIVVFNWPTDTVRYFRDQSGINVYKPLDKKSNYVKRCVGIPGDQLEIIEGYIYINGERTKLGERAKPQYTYLVYSKNPLPDDLAIYKSLGSRPEEHGALRNNDPINNKYITYYFKSLTEEVAGKLRKTEGIDSVVKVLEPKGNGTTTVFPHKASLNWNADNYGPITIPAVNKSVDLNIDNLPFYKRIIETYEGHKLEVKGSQIYIDGKIATSYTFGQDYYWMMGDNRHNSEDSRYWGFVPFDHVLGKPVFVWFSWDSVTGKPRWDRLFTTVDGGGDGEPKSYLMYFLILLAGYIGFEFFRKKKKKA